MAPPHSLLPATCSTYGQLSVYPECLSSGALLGPSLDMPHFSIQGNMKVQIGIFYFILMF